MKTAFELLVHDEETVLTLLDTLGFKYLGEKDSEVEKQYRRLLASREVAMEIMPIVFHLYGLKEGRVTPDKAALRLMTVKSISTLMT